MSSNVKRYLNHLQVLQNSSPKQIRSILKVADKKLVEAICEVCLNFCQGNFPNNRPNIREKLKKYQRQIHQLASNKSQRSQLRREREILCQGGAGVFLPIILELFVPSLAAYALEKFRKASS
jgi:hypothetical protein